MTEKKLTPEQRALLAVISTSLSGSPAPELTDVDFSAFTRLCLEQKLFPFVFSATHKSFPRELFPEAKRRATLQIMTQTRATADVLEVLSLAKEKGISLIPVKGVLCRDLFPEEYLRPSGDEDLFAPEDYDAAESFLLSQGFFVSGGQGTSVVTFASSKTPLRIELHKSLFPSDGSATGELNGFFASPATREYILRSGRAVTSLEPEAHLLYLILHAYKHFIHSGFGLRQVCDICLWAKAYAPRIDFSRLFSDLASVNSDVFALGVFALGAQYLGLSALPEEYDRLPDPLPMLRDILDSGIYGSSTEDRLHTSNVTASAVAAEKAGKKSSGMFRTLFPGKSVMLSRYPSLKKSGLLLPFCHVHRIATYLFRSLSPKGPDPGRTVSLAGERIELLKLYGIIK